MKKEVIMSTEEIVKSHETEPVYSTHGLSTSTEVNGVYRKVSIHRFSNGKYRLSFESYWEGKDAPPTATDLLLNPETVGVLQEALFNITQNREDWRVPNDGGSS